MKKVFLIILIGLLLLIPGKVKAETFRWPSDGYIGWRYMQPTAQEGNHTGVDIWSNTGGGWNGGVTGNSNPVYAAYGGQVIYIDDVQSHGLIIKHRTGLYTNYWHVRDRAVNLYANVNNDTLLGKQDYANAVHVHFTVSSTASDSGKIDPSPFLNRQLNYTLPNVVAWMTQISRGNSGTCSGPDVVVQGQYYSGSFNCVSNSVDILPETTFANGSNVHIYLN